MAQQKHGGLLQPDVRQQLRYLHGIQHEALRSVSSCPGPKNADKDCTGLRPLHDALVRLLQ